MNLPFPAQPNTTGTPTDWLTLRRLVPPPTDPYLGDGTWEGLFAELGTQLPAEYVTLMDTYGSGSWSSWLNFFTPWPASTPEPARRSPPA
ncbi:hypothetical protein [Kribbella sp. NPDC051620]|uniref:hypothetical protein n=1 Tax=Kribbella sp. NPDC051620 TaxID=3364120 RepID=UPI00378F04C6